MQKDQKTPAEKSDAKLAFFYGVYVLSLYISDLYNYLIKYVIFCFQSLVSNNYIFTLSSFHYAIQFPCNKACFVCSALLYKLYRVVMLIKEPPLANSSTLNSSSSLSFQLWSDLLLLRLRGTSITFETKSDKEIQEE